MKKLALICTFATALIFGLAVSTMQGITAEEPRITGHIETAASDTLTTEELRHVAQAGARILTHVDRGRQALSREAYDETQHHIDQAQTLARVIENAMPTYTVQATFESGDARYTEEDEVKPLVVPIYNELVRRNVLAPVTAAMRAEAADSNLPIPTEIELVNTRAELNVALATAHLLAAESALQSEDYMTADNALRTVQTGVILTYTEADLPLELARENLFIARNFVEQGEFVAANAAMIVASDALERFALTAGENRTDEVSSLRQSLAEMAEAIDSRSEDDVIAFLEESWETVANWFEDA